MSRLVYIAAVGARTPVGLTAEHTAAAFRAGVSRITLHPFMVDHSGEPIKSARDGLLPPSLMGWERLLEIVQKPLLEVLMKLGTTKKGVQFPSRVHVLLGAPEPRPGWDVQDNERIVQALHRVAQAQLGPVALQLEVAAHGHASTLYAMILAALRIAGGHADLCIVGGMDSYLDADTVDWLQENSQLACGGSRSGFIPGEGAGFVAFASPQMMRQLNLEPLGEVVGAHHAQESELIKSGRNNLGLGMTEAVAGAVKGLRLPDEAADSIYCDINGERYRSEEWGFVATRLPHACRDATVYEAPASSWGDVGAASGALFAGLAVNAWARGYARGPRALLWAGSEAGLRAAVMLQQV